MCGQWRTTRGFNQQDGHSAEMQLLADSPWDGLQREGKSRKVPSEPSIQPGLNRVTLVGRATSFPKAAYAIVSLKFYKTPQAIILLLLSSLGGKSEY